MSCKDTPETRKQIVAHNSVYVTLKKGEPVVYEDDCPKAVIRKKEAVTS